LQILHTGFLRVRLSWLDQRVRIESQLQAAVTVRLEVSVYGLHLDSTPIRNQL